MRASPGIAMPPWPPPMLTLSLPRVARATVDPGRLGLDTSRVGPRVGLTEQLAPDDVLVQRRAHPARHLVVGGVLDEGEDDPAGDAVGRAGDAGGAELLLDDELLDGAGV